MGIPGLVIAAPASGAGKTTLTLALARALRRRGLDVAPFKVGPDYIDPGYLKAAAGREAINLDPWAMRPALIDTLLRTPGDLALIEGVMGLFDGAVDGTGSTADLAARLGLPVVLVVDVRGMGASVGALVEGFCRHRAEVEVAGVILNRVGSPRHAAMLRHALSGVEVLGAVPRETGLHLPERHLGLVQARELPGLDAFLEDAAASIAEAVDLDRLVGLARPARLGEGGGAAPLPPLGQRIAVARDDAFAFAYPALLQGWREAGAEIGFFSPLADERPAEEADAVYLPGGYPELHAERLAGAGQFLDGLRQAAGRGAWLFGECGGYMALGQALIDREGRTWPMAGLLPAVTSFAQPRRHLGYRRITALAASPLGPAGAEFAGHEFHYASEVERGGGPLFGCATADHAPLPAQGCRAGRVMGSFLHLIDRR